MFSVIHYGVCKHDPEKPCTNRCEYCIRNNEFHSCGKIDYEQAKTVQS